MQVEQIKQNDTLNTPSNYNRHSKTSSLELYFLCVLESLIVSIFGTMVFISYYFGFDNETGGNRLSSKLGTDKSLARSIATGSTNVTAIFAMFLACVPLLLIFLFVVCSAPAPGM